MVYQAELDDAPREVRLGFAGNLQRWWPKVVGVGNVLADASPAPTYQISKPDGTVITQWLGVSVTTVNGISRFDLIVDASNLTSYALAENYRIDIKWTYAGLEDLHQERFAVCVAPFAAQISLDDLVEEIADIRQTIAGQAQVMLDGRTAEAHASVMGVKAWVDVYMWLQARLRDQGQFIPRLIVDRWKIMPVLKAQTLYRIFRAEGSNGRSKDLADEWREEAKTRFSALGDLAYDSQDTGVATQKVHSPIEWSCKRSW